MISAVLREDIENIISLPDFPWKDMKDSSVLVTGATGLLGTTLVHTLAAANDRHGLGLRIIAHGRNCNKGKVLLQDCGVEFISGNIRQPFSSEDIKGRVDYIFHCAAITRSADMLSKPIDVIDTAVEGTKNVLELARKMRSRSVVYLSSIEVYGQTPLAEVTESDLGYLNLSNPRSSYPESKRLCECLCVGYYKQYGIPVKIARLALTFGAGVCIDDPRVFAQFGRNALAGEDIILHTEGKSRGNFCYTSDAVHALLLLLLKGRSGEAYNVANPDSSMTIREMAELVANTVCGGKASVIVNIPPDIGIKGYRPDDGFHLNVDKLRFLGWSPKHDIKDMYVRMLEDWRNKEIHA